MTDGKHNGQVGSRGGEEDLDPYEIQFLPQFRKGRGPEEPFVNEHGVTIGDHDYDSPESPLNHWSKDTDPSVMAGDEWVHPFKDVGFHTQENRDYFEKGISPAGGIFMHPDKDAAYPAYNSPSEGEGLEDDAGAGEKNGQPGRAE
jgi:hypothetical protein